MFGGMFAANPYSELYVLGGEEAGESCDRSRELYQS